MGLHRAGEATGSKRIVRSYQAGSDHRQPDVQGLLHSARDQLRQDLGGACGGDSHAGCRPARIRVRALPSPSTRGEVFPPRTPRGSKQLGLRCVEEVREMQGVHVVKSDLCCFGMQATAGNGEQMSVQKPTWFISNCPALLESLAVTCDGAHKHVDPLDGKAVPAVVYPPRLWETICRCIRKQKKERRGGSRGPYWVDCCCRVG